MGNSLKTRWTVRTCLIVFVKMFLLYLALVISLTPFQLFGCQADCVYPWTKLSGDSNCYAVSTTKMSYYAADKFCKTSGGYLLELRTEEQTRVLRQFLMPELNYWMGLNDFVQEGQFVWGSDYKGLDYTNWYKGEPDNHNNEDCVVLLGYLAFAWADMQCEWDEWNGPFHAACQ